MTDEELITALKTLKPVSELDGFAVFAADVAARAGIDLDQLERWTTAHGGGPLAAGKLKLRKGQRPQEAWPGKPQPFYAVPDDALR